MNEEILGKKISLYVIAMLIVHLQLQKLELKTKPNDTSFIMGKKTMPIRIQINMTQQC
jgi:hypothetical protein